MFRIPPGFHILSRALKGCEDSPLDHGNQVRSQVPQRGGYRRTQLFRILDISSVSLAHSSSLLWSFKSSLSFLNPVLRPHLGLGWMTPSLTSMSEASAICHAASVHHSWFSWMRWNEEGSARGASQFRSAAPRRELRAPRARYRHARKELRKVRDGLDCLEPTGQSLW